MQLLRSSRSWVDTSAVALGLIGLLAPIGCGGDANQDVVGDSVRSDATGSDMVASDAVGSDVVGGDVRGMDTVGMDVVGVDVVRTDAVDRPIPTDVPVADVPGSDVVVVGPRTAVTQFQFDLQRTGANRTETSLTVAALRAGRFGRDTAFAPTFDAQIYAQPLYLPMLTTRGVTRDVLFVFTLNNTIYALDAASGAQLWNLNLGAPVPFGAQSCGNIRPTIGIVGTPVIDRATNTMYAVAFNSVGGVKTFNLSAVDLTTGANRAGFPRALNPTAAGGLTLDTNATGERGALTFVNGRVYIPFGGLYGDCGLYHGWVLGIDPMTAAAPVAFATPGRGSGIWAVAGMSADGTGHLFTATGNGFTAGSQGEYVVRLGTAGAGPTFVNATTEYFTPSNRLALDAGDVDIGSVAPIVLPDHPGSSTPHLLFQSGKAGVGYLINRDNLGGTGTGTGTVREGVYSASLFGSGVYGASGAWSNGTDVYVFVPGRGTRAAPCTGTGGVMALRLALAAGASTFQVAWCSAGFGNPSPPAISSNGNNDAILWVAGGTSFRAYNVADGMEIYNAAGADALPAVRQWTPIVVADGRVFVNTGDTIAMYRLR